jgi:hypothetical protein
MPTARHIRLTAILAKIDQEIAEAESLTVAECDDDTLQGTTRILAELRETRRVVEGKLRVENKGS